MGPTLKAVRVVAGDVEVAGDIIRDSGLKSTITHAKKPGGLLLPNVVFLAPAFNEALSSIRVDFSRLGGGVTSMKEVGEILIEARRRLGDVNVAADDWLGKVFEVSGYRLPDVQLLEAIAVGEFVTVANRIVAETNAARSAADASGVLFHSGFTFMNAYYEMAVVAHPFTTIEHVHDISIRLPGQKAGLPGPDRGVFISNNIGQKVFVSLEFKTRGVAHKMKAQQGKRDDRLLRNEEQTTPYEAFDAYFRPHPKVTTEGGTYVLPKDEGATLAYTVEGQTDTRQTDFEKIILLRGAQPELRLPTDYLTKIGVRAGKRGSVTKATDSRGGEYVLLTVPVETDEWRRIIESMLRDTSWH